MKQLDTLPRDHSITPASKPDLKPASRLIVLVTETETDPAILARKIRELADSIESRVQLLSICPSPILEPGIRRHLVTLAAMVASPNIYVEWNIERTGNWLNAIRPYWHRGDMIVCFEDKSGAPGKPLHQVLTANLDAAIYVIRDSLTNVDPRPAWINTSLSWLGLIGLILGFFFIQARLLQPANGWFQQSLLYASLLAEGLAIWAWNDLIR